MQWRTVDCGIWAKRCFDQLQGSGRAPQIIHITPKVGRFLGEMLMPDGLFHAYRWHHHYAVLCDGNMHDEAYPGGLPQKAYRDRFRWIEVIEFTPVDYNDVEC